MKLNAAGFSYIFVAIPSDLLFISGGADSHSFSVSANFE